MAKEIRKVPTKTLTAVDKKKERKDTGIRVLKETHQEIRAYQEAFQKKTGAKLTDELMIKKALKFLWAELENAKI